MSHTAVSRLMLSPREARAALWRGAVSLVAILAVFTFALAFRGAPIWEDARLLDTGEGSFWDCFRKPFLGAYFRPLVSLSFWLDYRLWREETFMYHQTNVLIHALTTVALMMAVRAAFGSRRIAVVSGLLFAVQPAQVSAVAWIGGRTDSLCTLWAALFAWALICAAQTARHARVGALAAATVCFALAIFTKEQALALLPLVPLAFRCFGGREPARPRDIWRATAPFVIAAGLFLALARAAGPGLPATYPHDAAYRLELSGRTIAYYALLLTVPSPRWMHTLTVIRLVDAGPWTLWAGYIILCSMGWLVWRWRQTAPQAAWFLAFVMLGLAPVLNVIPVGSLIVAPFRASLAGLGVAAVMGWLVARPGATSVSVASRRLRAAVGAAFAAWCLVLTVWGAAQWENPLSIYTVLARFDPGSTYVREGIVGCLLAAERNGDAEKNAASLLEWFFGSATWRTPDAKATYDRDPAIVARVHQSNGDKRAPNTTVSDIYTLVGYARLARHDYAAAFPALQMGERFDPENGNVQLALGRWYYANRRWPDAITYFRRVLRVHPKIILAHLLLASSYGVQGRWADCCAAYRAAIRVQPWDGNAYLALAEAQERMGDPVGARETLRSALAVKATNEQAIRDRLRRLGNGPA